MSRNRARESFYAELLSSFAEMEEHAWCEVHTYYFYNGEDDYYKLGPATKGGLNAYVEIVTSEEPGVLVPLNLSTVSHGFGIIFRNSTVKGIHNDDLVRLRTLYQVSDTDGFTQADCDMLVQLGLFEEVRYEFEHTVAAA